MIPLCILAISFSCLVLFNFSILFFDARFSNSCYNRMLFSVKLIRSDKGNAVKCPINLINCTREHLCCAAAHKLQSIRKIRMVFGNIKKKEKPP